METVKVEVYTGRYQQEVIDLILAIQREEFGVPITAADQPDLKNIPSFYQKGNGNFWIALYGKEVVGTIALIDIGASQLALRKMFVRKEFRGSAFNTAQLLMDTVFGWMEERNCTDIFLGTIDLFVAAQKFYRKNGFDEVPKKDLPASFPAMTLDNTFFRKHIDVNTGVKILDYGSEHQPFFEKFNRDWIEKYFWMEPLDYEVLRYPEEHILKPGGKILMAVCGNEVAGTVALKLVEPGVYEFTKMAVDAKFRGRKVGQALAHAAIESASKLGAKKIILYSNTVLEPAISLYRKIGFEEIPVDGPYKRSNIKMQLIVDRKQFSNDDAGKEILNIKV
jgi:GNAT superfamily N-acetyltransferase